MPLPRAPFSRGGATRSDRWYSFSLVVADVDDNPAVPGLLYPGPFVFQTSQRGALDRSWNEG